MIWAVSIVTWFKYSFMPQIIRHTTNQRGNGEDSIPQKILGAVASGATCEGKGKEARSVTVLAYGI